MTVTFRKLGYDRCEMLLKAITATNRIPSALLIMQHLPAEWPVNELPIIAAYLDWCEKNKVELRRSTLEISFREFLKAEATELAY